MTSNDRSRREPPLLGAGGLTRTLLRLVVPLRCAGCGQIDEAWCQRCREPWRSGGFRCEAGAGRLDLVDEGVVMPVWALVPYEAAGRAAILAAKDGGRHDLHRELGRYLALAASRHGGELARPSTLTDIVVVPVPSSRRALARRGADLTKTLSRHVARVWGATSMSLLTVSARKRDQVGLNRDARRENARSSMRLRRRRRGGSQRSAVLVDDIVTSGATLQQCRAVLATSGVVTLGALVLGTTRPPGTFVRAARGDTG